MRTRLPPLSTLRLFDAAGRHLSFSHAAAELNVTPSAVSHGILALERALGIRLFLREAGKLSLTREGADYLAYVSEALSLILVGTKRLPTPHSGRTITVSCAPTFASRWLVPRLPRFRARHPRIAITVDTSHRHVGFPADGFDFAIRKSRIPVSARNWAPLFGESLVPVCRAEVRDGLLGRDGRVDLARATLIHLTSVSDDWQTWFDATGMADAPSGGTLHVDTIQLSVEAAAAGLGIALGRRPLADRELRDGTLVEVGPSVPAATAYWLVSAEAAEREQDLAGFRDWVLAEAEGFGATGIPSPGRAAG